METTIEVREKRWSVIQFFIQAKSMSIEAPQSIKQVQGIERSYKENKVFPRVCCSPSRTSSGSIQGPVEALGGEGGTCPRWTLTATLPAFWPTDLPLQHPGPLACGLDWLHLWCPQGTPKMTTVHRKCRKGRPTHPVTPVASPAQPTMKFLPFESTPI